MCLKVLKTFLRTSNQILFIQNLYLWSFSKDNVHQGNPQTMEELKSAITEKIIAIPKEECVKVIDDFARQVPVCTQQNGKRILNISRESRRPDKN